MEYKPKKTICSVQGCSYLRRNGQRTCASCHRVQERQRRADAKAAREAEKRQVSELKSELVDAREQVWELQDARMRRVRHLGREIGTLAAA